MKRGLSWCCLLVATSSYAQSAPSVARPVSIPFVTSGGMTVVPATVGGRIPIHVILDTGAGLDILAPSLVRTLHGRAAGTFSAHRMTGERIDVPLFVIPELAIGPLVRKDALVGAWDILDTLHVEGIVSVNGFRHRPFTIDFAHQTLTFETARTLARRRAGGRSSPLALDDLHGVALDLLATFLIDTQPGQCEIDTGSQNAAVSLRYLAPLGIDSGGADVVRRERRTIAGAREIRYSTRLPRISLGATPAITLERPSVSFSDIIYDCVIGTDFWQGRALTIDIAGRQLTVSDPLPMR
jgi:hypothetical protein